MGSQMLNVRSRAPKTQMTPALTVALATRQARKHVDAMMPGVMVQIDSRLSYDLATDTDTVITTVMFPKDHPEALLLRCTLSTLPGYVSEVAADSSIVVTRKRKR